jgi:hypothetical protein
MGKVAVSYFTVSCFFWHPARRQAAAMASSANFLITLPSLDRTGLYARLSC